MRLYLSESSHLFADYSNEQGEVIYRVQTDSRLKFWSRTTKISKQIPDTLSRRPSTPPRNQGSDQSNTDLDHFGGGEETLRSGHVDGVEMKDRFARLARIGFRGFKSSKFTISEQEFSVSKFFRKDGLGLDRIFTRPDGKEYKWVVGLKGSKLILNDGSNAEVANFHFKYLTLVHKREETFLEIMPNGEHMVDIILVTFLYVEKLRKDMEKSSNARRTGSVV